MNIIGNAYAFEDILDSSIYHILESAEFMNIIEFHYSAYGTKYVVLKQEPCQEVKSCLEKLEQFNEDDAALVEFVDDVAKNIADDLNQSEREFIIGTPEPFQQDFGLGLWIRNNYIHNRELDFYYRDADSLSTIILERVASLLIGNYDFYSRYWRNLYNNIAYGNMRRVYKIVFDEYPDLIAEKYYSERDYDLSIKKCMKAVKNSVMNKKRADKLFSANGVTKKNVDAFVVFVNQYYADNDKIIPYEIAVLSSSKAKPEIKVRWCEILSKIIKEDYSIAMTIPKSIIRSKEAALAVVNGAGDALERLSHTNRCDRDVVFAAVRERGTAIRFASPEFFDDRELVKTALADPYGDVLSLRCMRKYKDDYELVKIALKANGKNIEYASDRLRDDYDVAAYAVQHQTDYYPESTFCNLSRRLRDNFDLAVMDIKSGHAAIDQYSRRLRDCDEIAEVLLKSEESWKIYQMSKRIREKYGVL